MVNFQILGLCSSAYSLCQLVIWYHFAQETCWPFSTTLACIKFIFWQVDWPFIIPLFGDTTMAKIMILTIPFSSAYKPSQPFWLVFFSLFASCWLIKTFVNILDGPFCRFCTSLVACLWMVCYMFSCTMPLLGFHFCNTHDYFLASGCEATCRLLLSSDKRTDACVSQAPLLRPLCDELASTVYRWRFSPDLCVHAGSGSFVLVGTAQFGRCLWLILDGARSQIWWLLLVWIWWLLLGSKPTTYMRLSYLGRGNIVFLLLLIWLRVVGCYFF